MAITAAKQSDTPAGLDVLSRRERQIMGMIVGGLSNQEIAESLYLSINSVKTHIRSAYRKAGVTTRTQAVIWGVRQGLLDPGSPGVDLGSRS